MQIRWHNLRKTFLFLLHVAVYNLEFLSFLDNLSFLIKKMKILHFSLDWTINIKHLTIVIIHYLLDYQL